MTIAFPLVSAWFGFKGERFPEGPTHSRFQGTSGLMSSYGYRSIIRDIGFEPTWDTPVP